MKSLIKFALVVLTLFTPAYLLILPAVAVCLVLDIAGDAAKGLAYFVGRHSA